MRLFKSSLSLAVLATALSFPALAHAQDTAPQTTDAAPLTTDQKIEQLQAELDTLKRQRDLDQELAASAAAKNPVATVDKKGAKFVSADGKYEFDLNAQVNVDAHSFGNDGGTLRDEVQNRLIRPTFTVRAGNATIKFTPELGGTSVAASSIVDAYVEYKATDLIQFRAGKYKSPLGLERLQADADVIWTERGHSTNLVPNRDLGYQLFGAVPGLLEYQVGLFDGAADGVNFNNDLDNHKDVAYRIFATPLGDSDIAWLQGFGIGYAGSDGKHLGTTAATQLGTYKTPGQQTFFSYSANVFSNGKETRSNPQAYFYLNNFGLLADYVEVRQDVKLGANTARLKHRALDVSGSWVLTGESVGYKGGVKPTRDFNIDGSGWGALELTARYGYTDVDDATFTGGYASLSSSASKATSTGVGIAWYLSENLKLIADWDHTKFVRGAAVGNRLPEDFASGRVQFRY
jgi:phosphate-selective porin OprO/OprP